jgi:hypothetical protein
MAGESIGAIAASETLSARRVHQIVRDQLDRRDAKPADDFALLQIARLWPIARSGPYFGCGAEAPPEVPGGGTTFGSPVLGAGFWMPGSTSFGWMTPFDWLSSLLRFSAGALAPGVISSGAGLVAWANAALATRVTPATIMQSRELMIRMRS